MRPVAQLPAAQRISGVLVLAPAELIAYKTIAYHVRRGQPKSDTDWRNLALLLLKFPELKSDPGPETDYLKAAGADEPTLAVWRELVTLEIRPEEVPFFVHWHRNCPLWPAEVFHAIARLLSLHGCGRDATYRQ